MKRFHHTALAVAAALAAVVALPSAASAQARAIARPQAAPLMKRPQLQLLPQDARSYAAYVESRLAQSKARIEGALRRNQVSPAASQAILRDVAEGARLIRVRVASTAQDGGVTIQERQAVALLASAIAADLTRTYGGIDSWQLL